MQDQKMQKEQSQTYNHLALRAANDNEISVKPEQVQMKPTLPTLAKPQLAESSNKIQCLIKIVSILLPIILMVVSVTCFYYFYFVPKVEMIKQPKKISFGDDQSFYISQGEIRQNNLFKPNSKTNFYVTYAPRQSSSRLLQQTKDQNYLIFVNFNKLGINAIISSNNDLTFVVNQQKLLNYLQVVSQQKTQSNQNNTQNNESLTDQLSKAFSQMFQVKESVKVVEEQYIDVVFNQNTKQLQVAKNQNTRLMQQRMLRRGCCKGIVKPVAPIIPPIIKPTIQIIRKHGPQIGYGVGFVIAGPPGAQKGKVIGGVAKNIIQACVPENQVKFSCNRGQIRGMLRDQIKNQLINGATGYAKNKIQINNPKYVKL